MTANVVNAAVSTKTSPTNSPKKKQKKRVKSKCRLRRFYGKHCSHHRKEMGSKSFITFTGSWLQSRALWSVSIRGPKKADVQGYNGEPRREWCQEHRPHWLLRFGVSRWPPSASIPIRL